jgi:large subunit ribosomal protein L17
MFRHMSTSLFKFYLIKTTIEKAKEARAFAEPLITLARRGEDPQAQRQIRMAIEDKLAYKALLEKIGPLYADRKGGYTRIIRVGRRPGDGAEEAILELVDREKLGPPPGRPYPATKKKEAKAKV